MAIYADPTADYARDKRRINFERIRESGNVEELENFMEAFIARGHDPNDPRDEMWSIMGVTPEYFDFMRHEMAASKLANTDKVFKQAAGKPVSAPAMTQEKSGNAHGKGKRHGLTFGPEDE